ncbi:hypothetical protein NQ314_001837 [Rhamnusium bicolor]|uniref:DUF4371 domain-containing protein n=1 Tax=Rhamnusium bicolor TaxID=1586634 RepID=A0AAV8ZRE2_9CUCU|nr:hypothetical protein NQ314_001837 [Rhamnusium bicolor]
MLSTSSKDSELLDPRVSSTEQLLKIHENSDSDSSDSVYLKDSLFITGFNDWKNRNSAVDSHEKSLVHTTCLMELRTRGNTKMRVDYAVLQQLEEEKGYWRNLNIFQCVDSTPDLARIDQLTSIIKYINNTGIPQETFLAFIPNPGHESEELEVAIVNFIENGLNLNNCHGQSYDNASNMSGHYSDLQARLKERNPFIDYVPCAAHSLNLIGSCASESCQEVFISTLQELYNFFTASTNRWQIFVSVNKDKKFLTLKTLSKIRLSARHDACGALTTKSEARGLVQKLNKFETVILAKLWTSILGRFNVVNKKLQSINIDLASVVSLYNSLTKFVETLRTDFSSFENFAKSCSDIQEYQFDLKRTKKRKLQFDESHAGETAFENSSHHFKIYTFYVIIDNLHQELIRRKIVYENLLSDFRFLEKDRNCTTT